jgi:hypothetical protein
MAGDTDTDEGVGLASFAVWHPLFGASILNGNFFLALFQFPNRLPGAVLVCFPDFYVSPFVF